MVFPDHAGAFQQGYQHLGEPGKSIPGLEAADHVQRPGVHRLPKCADLRPSRSNPQPTGQPDDNRGDPDVEVLEMPWDAEECGTAASHGERMVNGGGCGALALRNNLTGRSDAFCEKTVTPR
jgi:hypothetical protein